MSTFEEIRDAALRLPASERMMLAHELLQSLDPPGVRVEDLQSVLTSRIAGLESGEEEIVDGPSAVAEIRQALRRRTKAS